MSRHVNPLFDDTPTIHQLYNYSISRKYIRNKKVLDVGCWTGILETLAVDESKEMVGIDPNSNAINHAQKRVPKATFFIANAARLPFRSKSFDVVLLFEVLEHVPKNSEIAVLKEICRVLKTGGYLVVSTPNRNFISILLDPAYFLLSHRHYSLEHLRRLLTASDFEINNIYKTGGLFLLIWSIIEIICKHLANKKPPMPNWLENKISQEYKVDGFAGIHIVAKKK